MQAIRIFPHVCMHMPNYIVSIPHEKIQLACETRRRESRKGDRCRNIGCADIHTAYNSTGIHTSSWTFFLPRASLAFSAFISSSLSCRAFVSWSSLRFAFCTSSSSSWSSSTFFLASFSYVREGGRGREGGREGGEGGREGGKHVYSTLSKLVAEEEEETHTQYIHHTQTVKTCTHKMNRTTG